MKKVFVSLPMAGRSKEDILSTQEQCRQIAETMLGDSTVLIQSYFENSMDVNHSAVWDLGQSISYLSTADVAVFAPGSKKCRGCKVERMVANLYKIPTIDLSMYGFDLSSDTAFYKDNHKI